MRGQVRRSHVLVQHAAPEGGEGSRQTILLARGMRTIRMCSFDARSEGQSGESPQVSFGEPKDFAQAVP